MESKYAITIHCVAWNDASNARAKVGKPELAMLVSSEGIHTESERLAKAQRGDDAVGGAMATGA